MDFSAESTFHAVVDWLTQHCETVESADYYNEIFGNFIVSFTVSSKRFSFVNDRFELLLCDKPAGDGKCEVILDDIRTVRRDDLLNALMISLERLKLSS